MRRFLLSLVLAVAVAGPGITWVAPAEAADATVTLTDRANPATLTVAPGTRVTFANQSGERKRIRSEDGPAEFDSGNLEAGAGWSVVLDAAGTHPYVDDRDRGDPAYHGTITVGSAAPGGGGSANTPAPGQPPAGSPAPSAPTTAAVAILDRSFSPTTVQAGGTFSQRFDRTGTFQYICAFHSEMAGTVEIVESPSAPAPELQMEHGEQAAAPVKNVSERSWPSGAAVLAALVGGAALLAGTGALLYGGSRMLAAGDRP